MIGHNNRIKHRGLIFFISLGTMLLATTSVWSASDSELEIIARIKPVGMVCIAGEPCEKSAPTEETSASTVLANAAPVAGRSGEAVYNSACVVCHGAGVAGAPIVGNKDAWSSRIAKGDEALFNSAINGINAMPPRGTCMGCSDEELQAAVKYMTDSSQ
ncbi:MAG: cytochrome c5 family protein [Pseudomonadales bacterium]|nr:cytochrome c5 family protein [Pseudomonadales bacterium]